MTSEIPKEKIKGAIIIKGTQNAPLQGELPDENEEDEQIEKVNFPEDYFYLSLKENCPKTIIIAFEKEFEGTAKVAFPFIKVEEEGNLKGVTISHDIDWDGAEK